jgi:hypothetical protein
MGEIIEVGSTKVEDTAQKIQLEYLLDCSGMKYVYGPQFRGQSELRYKARGVPLDSILEFSSLWHLDTYIYAVSPWNGGILTIDYSQSLTMSSPDSTTHTPTTTPTVATPDPPYSIFDKRQKWLIIIIVSTAATCES